MRVELTPHNTRRRRYQREACFIIRALAQSRCSRRHDTAFGVAECGGHLHRRARSTDQALRDSNKPARYSDGEVSVQRLKARVKLLVSVKRSRNVISVTDNARCAR